MRYQKFKIQNYKGIQKIEIDLDKEPKSKIFALVGLNESGKTTILEAISMLSNQVPKTERYKLIPKKDKLSFDGKISVKADIRIEKMDHFLIEEYAKTLGYPKLKEIKYFSINKEYTYKNSLYDSNTNYWNIDLRIEDPVKKEFVKLHNYKKEDWEKLTTYIEESLLPKILYYPNFLFDFPNRIYLDKEYAEKNQQIEFFNIIQDILTLVDDKLNINDHLIKKLESDSADTKESLEHTLSKMSSAVSKIVLAAWRDVINIQGKEILIKSGYDKVLLKHYLEFKLKEGSEQYFISERSLGFKWFFTFLLFTEIRKVRKTDSGETLFLLDEPASNLHSTAQEKLLDKFADLTKNSTLVYTTHSHHLINPKWLNGVHIVRNKSLDYKKAFDLNFDLSDTNIEAIPYRNFIASNPTQQDYFQPILDSLEYKPGLLEKVPGVIITEGKFDYYTLKYFNEVIFKNKFKKIHFFPGTGANNNCRIISLYLAWNRAFVILLDSDKAGIKAKDLYLKEFGEIVRSKIKTYNEIVPSLGKVSMEGIFTEDERLKLTQMFKSDESKFDKGKFNTSMQNLYIKNESYQFSDSTIKNFKSLLGGIEKAK